MGIPPEFVEELRNRLSISQVVGRRVRLQKRGREHTGLCPFHNEKTPSFTVSDDKNFFHCFGCGAHGDVVGFVMRSEGLPFPEAVERLAREAGMEVPVSSPEERRKAEKQATLHGALEAAAKWFEAQLRNNSGRAGMEYFRRRGLRDETIDRFRLGFAPDDWHALKEALKKEGVSEELQIEAGLAKKPDDGRAAFGYFRNRVMFPITDRRGRVIAFGGRILDQGEPKYLNSPETPLFHKGRVLYGLAQAQSAAREKGEVVVCEGYMDVIALAEAGLAGAVAPLGTALTEDQILELWRLAPEPILCFDGDAAGQRAASRAIERALPLLSPGKSLRFAILPPGDDPDSLVRRNGGAAMTEALSQARPLVDVIWDQELAARPADTPERRAGLRQRLEERIRRIADRPVQEGYRQEIGSRFAKAFAPATPGTGRPQGPRPAKGPFGARRPTGFPDALSAGGAAARLGTAGLERHAEEQLLALVVNHPLLASEKAEDLAHLTLWSQSLDKLRKAIIDHAAARPDLDADELKRHLNQTGYAGTLQTLLDRTRDKKFTLPNADLAQAADALSHLIGLLRERDARRERDEAAHRLGEEGTPESFARFDSARRATLEGESKRRDIDGPDPAGPEP
ncbi:MAG TPA: DNA primase, partial [Dongiaceae bacterium]